MRHIRLQFQEVSYPVWIGTDCWEEIVGHLATLDATSYHLITDETVERLHAGALAERLSREGAVHSWTIPEGEDGKTLSTIDRLAQRMMRAGANRRSVVVAMGGGVVGNVAGLLAALLFRGIRLVHIPTTLIAMGDSVASLKQAVNLPQGKNLLGCFYTPTSVLIDIAYLSTLPAVQIRSGLCEIIKNALILGGEQLELVQRILRPDARYDPGALDEVVEAGLRAKQRIMIHDKRERAEAIVFEYGHTVGHAIELASGGAVPHGEAVGLGMIAAAEIAHAMGGLSADARDLHYALIRRNGAPLQAPAGLSLPDVMTLIRSDNKRGYIAAGPHQVPMILLNGPGSVRTENGWPLTLVDATLVAEVLDRHLFRQAAPEKVVVSWR